MHSEGEQFVTFRKGEEEEILERVEEGRKKSAFEAFLELNQQSTEAHDLTYEEVISSSLTEAKNLL